MNHYGFFRNKKTFAQYMQSYINFALTQVKLERASAKTHYVLLLCSFKEQLQQHAPVHAMEGAMACWEIEQSLQSLTISPREGTGITMSDDDANLFDGSLEWPDTMGFGPLIPTES